MHASHRKRDSSRPEFWDVRYAAGETPWDFHGVPAALKAFLKTSQTGNVLIPGCGAGYEVRAFHEAGWKVTAIDFSPVAVERARSQLGALAKRVVQGDFFTHDFGSRHFDVIYERTCESWRSAGRPVLSFPQNLRRPLEEPHGKGRRASR